MATQTETQWTKSVAGGTWFRFDQDGRKHVRFSDGAGIVFADWRELTVVERQTKTVTPGQIMVGDFIVIQIEVTP